jgi:integrase
LEYLDSQGFKQTTVDRLDASKTKDYGYWFLAKPKTDGTSRSREQINNSIAEVKRMYRFAVEQKYISAEKVPRIERVGEQPDDGHKRDIFTLDEYEQYWKFLEYKYIKEREVDEDERQKRIIFAKSWGILMNTGMRPKELLGLKVKEINSNPHIKDEQERKRQVVLTIRADNSKTGRSRRVVAPIKRRVELILKAYKNLGITHTPEDYLLISPTSKERKQYTRQALYQRLKMTLDQSGLSKRMAKEGKSISLYSARHTYITWRLRYGGVPIHLLAKQAGTSVDKIERTYGHIEVEKQAEEITRAQGKAVEAEVDFISILGDEDE